MLKFHRARFNNFVVLRDVELEFADTGDRLVSVIRAENGTGKTTCLRGLEWVLYGDQALPKRGKYEIQPLDWTPADGAVEVSGELEFTVTHTQRKPGGASNEVTERYTLVRKADVRPGDDGTAAKFTQKPTLLRHDESGHVPITEPQSLIDGWLPLALREFFFTDGDEALAYIAADESSARRSKVEGAVKALLGLDLVEGAADRLTTKTARELRKQAAKESGESDLEELTEQIESLEDTLASKNETRTGLVEDLQQQEQDIAKLRASRDEALERGNKEKLKEDLATAREERSRVHASRVAAQKDLSRLLRHPSLEAALLKGRLAKIREVLEPMQQSGRIPASHIPFLRDRLDTGRCVCGRDLDSDADARKHIEEMLADSQQESQAANRLNELFTEAGEMLRRVDQPEWHWPTLLVRTMETESTFSEQEQELGRKIATTENTIASLPDTDIQTLTRQLESAIDAAGKLKSQIAVLDDDIEKKQDELERLKSEAAKKEASVDKVLSWRVAETVADDIGKVLQATIDTLKNEKVAEVSGRMDNLFREMIVADSDNAIIKRAVLTPDYDILVEGPGDRTLNPDTELNGASRRALTIAFILALAEVSGVSAPNVIDTPLGMTSGATRRELFRVAAENSSQLILFLTRSEIEGIQPLLDETVGSWHTLTAMAHYPTQIENRASERNETLVCSCSHREFCDVCERVGDTENPELSRRT